MSDWLDLVSACNVIDKADGVFANITGDWTRIEWERVPGGHRGIDVERELGRLGVKAIAGRDSAPASKEHPHGTLSCLVHGAQAEWAEYLLAAAGLVIVSEPIDVKSALAALARRERRIPAWSERGQQQPSVQLSGMNFAAPKKEDDGPVRRVLDWLRDG